MPPLVFRMASVGRVDLDDGRFSVWNVAWVARTLVVDPRNTNVVYAGTTEGLWRTEDRGGTWKRLTAHTWTINAIVLDLSTDDSERFFIAMDHGGVMETLDNGARFRGANWGLAQRQVSRLVADPAAPVDRPVLYAGVLHDGEFGGVFMTNNRGASWQQLSAGLKGLDVLSLGEETARSLGLPLGRLRVAATPSADEVRISTFPTLFGEKVVIRLFAGADRFRDLGDLGLPTDVFERLQLQQLRCWGCPSCRLSPEPCQNR